MNIRQFTQGIPDYDTFRKDIKTLRAVERELETMTQSIKDLWDEVYAVSGSIDWKAIAGMRDVLAHHYLTLADIIIWDVVQDKLPQLEDAFTRYLKI